MAHPVKMFVCFFAVCVKWQTCCTSMCLMINSAENWREKLNTFMYIRNSSEIVTLHFESYLKYRQRFSHGSSPHRGFPGTVYFLLSEAQDVVRPLLIALKKISIIKTTFSPFAVVFSRRVLLACKRNVAHFSDT